MHMGKREMGKSVIYRTIFLTYSPIAFSAFALVSLSSACINESLQCCPGPKISIPSLHPLTNMIC